MRGHLHTLAAEPSPSASLHGFIGQMHSVAEATFPAAYQRGKSQVLGTFAVPTIADKLEVDRHLAKNRNYLTDSLIPDVLGKIHRSALHLNRNVAERQDSLDRTFGYRVEHLYGGSLWTVTEAGFRAGVIALNAHHPYPLGQEDISTDAERIEAIDPLGNLRQRGWVAVVSRLLGRPEAELEDEYQTLQIGMDYHNNSDAVVCIECDDAAREYWYPEVPPLPGERCLGLTNCRCWLEVVTRQT